MTGSVTARVPDPATSTTCEPGHRLLADRWGLSHERPDEPVIDALLDAGLTVVVITPNQVKNLRGRYGSAGNKDDRVDTFVLADTLRTCPAALSDRVDPRLHVEASASGCTMLADDLDEWPSRAGRSGCR